MTHLPEQPADSLLLLLGGSKCSSLQYTHDARVTLVSTTLPEHPQGTGGAGLGMPNIVTLLFLGFNRDYFCSTRGRSNTEKVHYIRTMIVAWSHVAFLQRCSLQSCSACIWHMSRVRAVWSTHRDSLGSLPVTFRIVSSVTFRLFCASSSDF